MDRAPTPSHGPRPADGTAPPRVGPIPPGTGTTLMLLALAVVIASGAFRLGEAEGRRSSRERRRTAVVDAVRHAAPAVVSVTARTQTRRTITEGAGAGVIVHPAGFVVTNSHVVSGAQRVIVQLWQGNGTFDADVLINRPQDDLAILKLRTNRRFPYVSCCTGETVMLGETAIAIGNPRGLGDTITVGVVSAVGRDARMSTGVELTGLIQTDASINTGNSGGALLNLDGELMGVIVSLLPESSGIAFAIPASKVCPLVTSVAGSSPQANPLPPQPAEVGEGRIERLDDELEPSPYAAPQPHPPSAPTPRSPAPPSVGGRGAPGRVEVAPDAGAQQGTIPVGPAELGFALDDLGTGLRIRDVRPDTAAWRAGVLSGDILLSIDGRPVEQVAEVLEAFSQARPGRVYQLGVRRGRESRMLRIEAPAASR
ncbi:MAG: S1C family serine protease [Planctomycetota bacterium]